MVYQRRKVIAGRVYLYEVESSRGPDGKVRQRVVRYLGPEEPVYGVGGLRKGSKAAKE